MSAWLKNVHVQFWLTVIIGSALAAIVCPWMDSLYPNVWWWPLAWTAGFGITGFVLIHWWASDPARVEKLATALGRRGVD